MYVASTTFQVWLMSVFVAFLNFERFKFAIPEIFEKLRLFKYLFEFVLKFLIISV